MQGEQDEELIEVFKQFDKNGDSYVSALDLREVFVEHGLEISLEDCQLLIKLNDPEGNGKLSFKEFVFAIMAK